MSDGVGSSARVSILGAGLMGHGIAYLFAKAGRDVSVYDQSATARAALPGRVRGICALFGHDESLLDRIRCEPDLRTAVSDAELVIEAVTENLRIKQEIFRELERCAPAGAILATNTSALPIGAVTKGLHTAQRVVGAHFWNPPHLVALVEVVMMNEAHRPAAEKLIQMLRAAGRHPVLVRKDIPGFIGNRLQHALKREAIALVAAGVCDAETIDEVVKLGFGARMAVLGPLEQSDLVGLELTRAIHDVLMPSLDATPCTHPYLQSLVERGDVGMQSGRGFRAWTPESAQAVRDRLARFLVDAALEMQKGH